MLDEILILVLLSAVSAIAISLGALIGYVVALFLGWLAHKVHNAHRPDRADNDPKADEDEWV